ncbi:hypothetical protein CS238_05340 [Salmonella enterica]|nr:hypothetical protein [Salmonella enterica]EJC8747811.1 hypothetical protein [Salmonella enterica]HCM1648872.1 hypothetical protein [Salmonella enterica subsp. diarizonae serovar 48:i:z35]
MKIELKNLNSFNKFIESYNGSLELEFEPSATVKLQNKMAPKDLQNNINKYSEKVLPPVSKILPIIFYDFSVWAKFKTLPNNILGGLDTSYKPDKECIYIREKTFMAEKDFYDGLNKYTEKPIDINTATNITLLHELGHAVHHQTEKLKGSYLHEGTEEAKFINELMLFNEIVFSHHDESGKIVEIEMIARQATREGYADLYCCILLDKLYGSDKAGFIIKAIHDYREAVNVTERYYTHDSINEYLVSKDDFGFENFDDIHSYISSIVSKNAIKSINSDSRNFVSHSNFLGVINSVFGINEKDVKSASKKIEDRFPFLWVYNDKLVPWRFEHGTKDGKTWLDNRNLNALQRNIRTVKSAIENKVKNIMNNPYRKRP